MTLFSTNAPLHRRALAAFALFVWAPPLSAAATAQTQDTAAEPPASPPITLVIHGGAGALAHGRYTAEQEAAFKAKLNEALDAGYGVLETGGSALDAIEAAIVLMEDSPLFNAGKGAVFSRDGKNELDASIMDGKTLNAGAIAGVRKVRNPIKLARTVMEKSDHVMFTGDGAESFAEKNGYDLVNPRYFFTENRWRSFKDALKADKAARKKKKKAADRYDWKFGTVGAVALDRDGNIAAGTSTGGMTLKRWGRVGDAPIIGAGTFADNKSCGVSATGHGEYFMRLTIARDICAQVEYAGKNVEAAANDVIHTRLTDLGGGGGVIVLGATGEYALVFNTAGMFRGVRQEDGDRMVAIYGDQ
ncbi:MAG: isoaspartyl peptidase/L-asparaginase [Pseudomonadota bacterium]